MNKVGLVFEQFVDAFYYISLTQHHLVPQGHKLVFHVRLEPVNEMDALVEEVLKEFLQDSSIIQNISVTLSVVIIAIYVL